MSAAAATTLPCPPLVAKPAPQPHDKASARVGLNVLLREVVQATQANCEHANIFQAVVPVDQITDYHQFVDPRNATMCLEQILSRTSSCFYTSVQEFRREYEQVLANALAYNSPGHGRHAYKPIIAWAQDLLDVCCDELQCRQCDLAAVERELQEALTAKHSSSTAQGTSPRSQQKNSCPLSSMEALVAACELAAEQEGLEEEDAHYYNDVTCGADAGLQAQTQTQAQPLSGGQVKAEQQQGLAARAEGVKREVSGGGGEAAGATRGKAGARTAGYDTAPKYRRHKSKVYIRPNKVVYLPTTFMEDNFDPSSLPVNCEMIVETNGNVQPDRHTVSIKSVPRQGLSTMYCMTNVMKFQQRFLNWQILNWTKVDERHIMIHLQGPSGGCKGSRADVECADAPNLHKRKGGRDACDAGAACNEDDDAVGAGEQCEGSGLGQQKQQEEEEDRAAAPDNSKSRSSHNARGEQHAPPSPPASSPRRVNRCASSPVAAPAPQHLDEACTAAVAAVAAVAVGAAAGAAGSCPAVAAATDLGSGSSSPSHHDGGGRRQQLPAAGGGAGSQGSGEVDGGAQRSHELEISPANSTGNSCAQLQQQQQNLPLNTVQPPQQVQLLQPPYHQALQYSQHGFPFCLPFWGMPAPLAAAPRPSAFEEMAAAAAMQSVDPQLQFGLFRNQAGVVPPAVQLVMGGLSGLQRGCSAGSDVSAATGGGYKRCRMDRGGSGSSEPISSCMSPAAAPGPAGAMAAALGGGGGVRALAPRGKRPTDGSEPACRAAKLQHALSM